MKAKQPNIIFIITDQQRYDTINALGYPHMDTPNLDRLVAKGTVFTQCYAAAASCARCSGVRVPGMATMCSPCCRTQAIAMVAADMPWLFA